MTRPLRLRRPGCTAHQATCEPGHIHILGSLAHCAFTAREGTCRRSEVLIRIRGQVEVPAPLTVMLPVWRVRGRAGTVVLSAVPPKGTAVITEPPVVLEGLHVLVDRYAHDDLSLVQCSARLRLARLFSHTDAKTRASTQNRLVGTGIFPVHMPPRVNLPISNTAATIAVMIFITI